MFAYNKVNDGSFITVFLPAEIIPLRGYTRVLEIRSHMYTANISLLGP